MFVETGVHTEKELYARNEVKWETYTKKIQIEARVLGDLAMNHVIPVATKYQALLLDNIYKIKQVYPEDKANKMAEIDMALAEELAERIAAIRQDVSAMVNERKSTNKIESERDKAVAYHDKVLPFLSSIRYQIDKLELVVDNELWPLPKYRELLFTRNYQDRKSVV